LRSCKRAKSLLSIGPIYLLGAVRIEMKRSRKNRPNSAACLVFEAILEAAKQLGSDGKGRDGVSGYLRSLARKHPARFAALLVKVLEFEEPPKADAPRVLRTREEVEAEMRARGLPVPKEMFS
jgi:hypothetical protein